MEAGGQASLEAWARELAELRSEISSLATQVRAECERSLARLRSLEERRGEADARLDAARARQAAARRKLDDAVSESGAAKRSALSTYRA